MKKFLSFLGVCFCFLSATADTPVMLVFQTDDGNNHPIVAAGTQISFADGMMSAQNGDNTVTLQMDKLSKMFFSGDSLGVEMLGADMMTGGVKVYSLDGTFAGEFASMADACKALTPDVYIFRNNQSSIKLRIK